MNPILSVIGWTGIVVCIIGIEFGLLNFVAWALGYNIVLEKINISEKESVK